MKGKMTALLVLVFLGAGALLYAAYSAADKAQAKKAAKGKVKPGVMTEAERMAYIKAHVKVEGLALGPDKMPDRDEVVPGLYRVTGTVKNGGDQKLDRVHLAIYPKDEAGKVIGSYIQNIAEQGLPPGAAKEFKFQIPEKKEYAGTFDHNLR